MSEKTIGMLQGFVLSIVIIIGGCSIFPFLNTMGGTQSDKNTSIDPATVDYPNWTIPEPQYRKQAREAAKKGIDCNKHTL